MDVRVNETKDILNNNGKVIATIHGKLNIDIIANFFIKNPT